MSLIVTKHKSDTVNLVIIFFWKKKQKKLDYNRTNSRLSASLRMREKYQIWSFFSAAFSCTQTEYEDLQSASPYLARMLENTDQKNLWIWTVFE